MNHLWNIKEMMSIPSGSRNVSTSDYHSCSDSQLFCGSQFRPENSQSTSEEMSLSSRNSQQSSQEGSDPRFSSNYYTKPLLFGESKDTTLSLLNKFEEEKKKVKGKTHSDLLAKEYLHIQETLDNIQQLVSQNMSTEKNATLCQTVLESLSNFSSTMQKSLTVLQSDVTQQYETLINKVNSQKEMLIQLEERVQKSGNNSIEMDSNIKCLKTGLEGLREEQEREKSMLEEALKLLNAIVSEHQAKPRPGKVKDSATQMSPEQIDKLENTHFTAMPSNVAPPQNPRRNQRKTKSTPKPVRSRRKRPLVPSHRESRGVSDENSQPLINSSKKQDVSTPLRELRDVNDTTIQDDMTSRAAKSSESPGCFINPHSCWSQGSNSPVCLSPESKAETAGEPEGFWQLFDMNF